MLLYLYTRLFVEPFYSFYTFRDLFHKVNCIFILKIVYIFMLGCRIVKTIEFWLLFENKSVQTRRIAAAGYYHAFYLPSFYTAILIAFKFGNSVTHLGFDSLYPWFQMQE